MWLVNKIYEHKHINVKPIHETESIDEVCSSILNNLPKLKASSSDYDLDFKNNKLKVKLYVKNWTSGNSLLGRMFNYIASNGVDNRVTISNSIYLAVVSIEDKWLKFEVAFDPEAVILNDGFKELKQQ